MRITYPDRDNYPRHASASTGTHFIDDNTSPPILELSASAGSAQFSHNLARNSPTPLSNFEIETLIFCGFQGVSQNTLRGITCEILGGLSGTCGIDGIYGRM